MKRFVCLIFITFMMGILCVNLYAENDDLFYTIEETKTPIKEKTIEKTGEMDKKELKDEESVDTTSVSDEIRITSPGGRYIGFGNKIIIGKKDILYEDLSLVSSVIKIKGILNGSLTVVFGDITVEGTINGNVNVLGGSLTLKDGSVVNGNISFIGNTFEKEDNAVVHGNIISKKSKALNLLQPFVTFIFSGSPESKLFYSFLWNIIKLALILLIIYLFKKSIFRISDAVKTSPFIMFILGFLTFIILIILIILSFMVVFLVPIGVALVILGGVIAFYLYAVLTSITGDVIIKVLKIKKINWFWRAVLGYIFLFLINLIPTFGIGIIMIVECFLLGSFMLTSFGRKHYISKKQAQLRITE